MSTGSLHSDVLIVGAGQAGAQAACALRGRGFEGSVTMIGTEPDLPYERPPLSKEFLSGDKAFAQLLVRPAEFWPQHRIDIRLGRTVVTVDAQHHHVTCDTGERISYGKLVWAAGGSPRRLSCPGQELSGIHTVRTRGDVDLIRQELASAHSVVIVGGGYVGLEAAAVLTKFSKSITLVETADRVLSRVAGEALSRFLEQEHLAHAVGLLLGTTVARMDGQDGRVSGVHLGDGSRLPADMVIVGIGIVPTVTPLLDAGAAGAAGGILVDPGCQASLPDVFAIGDCAAHHNPYSALAQPVRLESVQNANDQANVAARVILGESVRYEAVPWFWSNQYDLKLQTVGLSAGHDDVVLRGDPSSRSFSVIYLKEGRVLALDCVNAVRDYVQGKHLVEKAIPVDRSALRDPATSLKTLLAPA